MVVHKISETTNNITLGWNPPIGVEFYLFYAGGKRVSNAPPVDKNGHIKNMVQFSKAPSPWEIVAVIRQNGVMSIDVGYYPPVPVPNSETYSADPYSSAAYSH